jgi:pimeloyl-ACP methyl ester carboxylesterase
MLIVMAASTTGKLILRGSSIDPARSATIGGVLSAGLVVLGAVSAPLTALWLLQRRLIYFPDTAVPSPASVLPRAQEITLRTEDGLALGAWHVSPTRGDCGITVLVMPGNGGSRELRAPLARRLAAKGFAVLLLDYRGYGGNPGSPSENGLISDARAARAYLVDHGVAPERLIYFGESLGAAVATRLAAEQPPGALVLRSPFTDLAAVGARHYPMLPVRLLLRDRFPVTALISQVRVPTAVVYGSADAIVPPEQSAAVAAAAAGPVRVVEMVGADHNDNALLEGNELVAAVVDLARLLT